MRQQLRRKGSFSDVGPELAAWKATRNYQPVIELMELPDALQKRLGDLRARLKAVSFQGRLGTTHFGKLVTDQLKMKDNDLLYAPYDGRS